jgi:hypothetical protein
MVELSVLWHVSLGIVVLKVEIKIMQLKVPSPLSTHNANQQSYFPFCDVRTNVMES